MSREMRRQIEFLRADVGTLKAMLAERQGEGMAARLSRFGLEQRLEVAEAELAALEADVKHEPERAHVEMTFRGGAVVGSEGIEAGFAGAVARQYPALVRAMRRKHFPRKRGGASQAPEPRLLLTGTARGSFGLVFEEEALEVTAQPELWASGEATPLCSACEHVAELLEEVTSADAPLEVFLEQPTSVRGPLKELLSALKKARVSMRVSSAKVARGWRELSAEQLEWAANTITSAAITTELVTHQGVMLGLNPLGKHGTFAMKVGDAKLLQGSAMLTEDEGDALVISQQFSARECWALIATTTFERRGAREQHHALLDVASSKEELMIEDDEA